MASTPTLTKLLSCVAFNQVNSQLGVRTSRPFSRLISSSLIYVTNQACDPKATRITGVRRLSCLNWHGIRAKDLTVEKLKKYDTDVGCPICRRDITFSYKDVLFLAQFMSPRGYILNRRVTGVCKKQQRKLEKAIKISQRLGLLPKLAPSISPPKYSNYQGQE